MMAAGGKLVGILVDWRGYAAAALAGALAAGSAAWTAQGWRYGADIATMRSDESDRVSEAQRQAREILQRRYAAVGVINERNAMAEWAAYGGLSSAQSKMTACGLILMLGAQRLRVHATSSPPPVVECPEPESPPAWIMEPAPNLIPLLDRIISPYEPVSGS
ncbi:MULTISPECIES: Rz1 family lipoprotein [unclassified Achromobacter]|uniref:Rz1 family lipoprotein n=1 Tax=unclassified Achromobacter TaxID=2626865 RepID=UPI002107F6BD|nr:MULTISPECIES: Rz1 family lipoprotein [unclassified Achromobacter]